MHRSSDTIATIAAALAKAQVELTNPEESLVATIRSPFASKQPNVSTDTRKPAKKSWSATTAWNCCISLRDFYDVTEDVTQDDDSAE